MESAYQKPKQSDREGEVAEGLPGSEKSVASVKRNTKELGRPRWFRRGPVGEAEPKEGERRPAGSQTSSIDTQRTGEPFTRGKGLAWIRQPTKETLD